MNTQPILRTQKLYFSPTKTTKRVLEAISSGMGLEFGSDIDLTRPNKRMKWKGNAEGELILVGSPIWGQAIPPLYLRELEKLEGTGKLAVAVGVYGNVKTKQFLEQLCGLLREKGFQLVAAAYFVAEHSFVGEQLKLGKNRPNAQDLEIAKEFGKKIAEKINNAPDKQTQKEEWKKFGKIEVESVKPVVKTTPRPLKIYPSSADQSKCTKCQDCMNACPVDCIDPETLASDLAKCVQCMACVRFCPEGAKKVVFDVPEAKIQGYRNFEEPAQNPRTWV